MFSAREILKLPVETSQGVVGKLEDLHFDERSWKVSRALIREGAVLSGAGLAVPANLLGAPDATRRIVMLGCDLSLLQRLRGEDRVRSFSEVKEERLGHRLLPTDRRRTAAPGGPLAERVRSPGLKHDNGVYGGSNVRSVLRLIGYRVSTPEGPYGRIADFLIEPDDWGIRYLILSTWRWKPKRLAPPAWVEEIRWEDSEIEVSVSKPRLKSAPRFQPKSHDDLWRNET